MNDSRYANRPDILLVEDNPDDVFFMKEVMSQSERQKNIHVVPNGEAALGFLRREPPYEDAPRPSLIILDLKLPRMSGVEFLKLLKDDKQLRAIPVIVLSTSDAEADAAATYDLHATSFVTKPKNLDDFADVMKRIEDFWLKIAQLPPRY